METRLTLRETALSESEERYRLISEVMSDYTFLFSLPKRADRSPGAAP